MALQLESNITPPKMTFNTSKLQQGLSVNLSKTNPNLRKVGVKINWLGDDLDISAVCKGADGNALLVPMQVNYKGRNEVVPKDLIFYMNLEQKGIKHGGDLVSSGDEEMEQILVAVSDLDSIVHSIDFIVTSHTESNTPLTFADIKQMRAELVDLDTNEVVYSTDLVTDTTSTQTGACFATLTKDGSQWSYKTDMVGLGVNPQGVQNILTNYYS